MVEWLQSLAWEVDRLVALTGRALVSWAPWLAAAWLALTAFFARQYALARRTPTLRRLHVTGSDEREIGAHALLGAIRCRVSGLPDVFKRARAYLEYLEAGPRPERDGPAGTRPTWSLGDPTLEVPSAVDTRLGIDALALATTTEPMAGLAAALALIVVRPVVRVVRTVAGAILRLIPYWADFQRELIDVTVTAHPAATTVVVERRSMTSLTDLIRTLVDGVLVLIPPLRGELEDVESHRGPSGTETLSHTREVVRSPEDHDALALDVSLMILSVHGIQGLSDVAWSSLRDLVLGAESLLDRDDSPGPWIDSAIRHFERAIEIDRDNVDALVWHATLVMWTRKRGTLTHARRSLTLARHVLEQRRPRTPDIARLLANTIAGEAFCAAQSYHRLASSRPALRVARNLAAQARARWDEASGEGAADRNPFHLYIRGLVLTVDEEETELTKRSLQGLGCFLVALAEEPENYRLLNNVGYILLRIAESATRASARPDLDAHDPQASACASWAPTTWNARIMAALPESVRERSGNTRLDVFAHASTLALTRRVEQDAPVDPALLAEDFFRRSLWARPQNKLPHANLCRLYATSSYRELDRRLVAGSSDVLGDWNRGCSPLRPLDAARTHARRALGLDGTYVNGLRDFAEALLWYDADEEARAPAGRAVDLAQGHGDSDKVGELMHDFYRVLIHRDAETTPLEAAQALRALLPDAPLRDAPGWAFGRR